MVDRIGLLLYGERMRFFLLALCMLPGISPTAFSQTHKFQQDIKYTVEAILDTTARKLTGSMVFSYRNNAPDTLQSLYFQIPSNAFHDDENTAVKEMQRFNRNNVKFTGLLEKKLTINSIQFLSIGSRTSFPLQAYDFTDTILKLPLPVNLHPGERLEISIYFEQDLKLSFKSKKEEVSLDMVNWFPKVAVYSESGWNVEPFHFMMNANDIFTDFAEMDVKLTIPGNYVIAASGDLIEGDPGWESVHSDTSGTDSLYTVWHDSIKSNNFDLALTAGPRVLRFKNERAHGFTWVASPNLSYYTKSSLFPVHIIARGGGSRNWEKDIISRIDTVLAFMDSTFYKRDFANLMIVQTRRNALSQPAFFANGDSDLMGLTISYATMYIPGMVGTNGVKESWIAKGLAIYYGKKMAEWRWGKQGYGQQEAREEMNWLERQYPLPSLDNIFRNFSLLYKASGQDEAISKKINHYKDPVGAFFNMYVKAEIFYEMLEYVIGEKKMQAGLTNFISTHRHSHATESDLRAAFERASGEDLDWFFKQWLHGTPTIDYAKGDVKKYRKNDSTWVTEVDITRKGDGIMPIDVEVNLGGDKKVVKRWAGKEQQATISIETPTRPKAVKVDPNNSILDNNMMNNGSLAFEFKPDLPMLKYIHMPSDAYLVLWRPIIGYNDIDGARIGLRTRGSYRTFFSNVHAELSFGLKNGAPNGKLAWSHPLRRSNLMNRYSLSAQKQNGIVSIDTHISLAGSDGIISTSGRSLQFGVNYTDVTNTDYYFREVASDSGVIASTSWEGGRTAFAYADASWRFEKGILNTKFFVNATASLPGYEATFSQISGKIRNSIEKSKLRLTFQANAGTFFNKNRIPLQDQFHVEGASARQRFMHNSMSAGSDITVFKHRFVEGGANLRGYQGQPMAITRYQSLNIELGLKEPIGIIPRFGVFYDLGRVTPQGDSASKTLSNAGFHMGLFDANSPFLGGNIPLFEGLTVRAYFPIWLSQPLPGREKKEFRWYVSIGKAL